MLWYYMNKVCLSVTVKQPSQKKRKTLKEKYMILFISWFKKALFNNIYGPVDMEKESQVHIWACNLVQMPYGHPFLFAHTAVHKQEKNTYMEAVSILDILLWLLLDVWMDCIDSTEEKSTIYKSKQRLWVSIYLFMCLICKVFRFQSTKESSKNLPVITGKFS